MPELAPVTTNGRAPALATRRAGVAGVGRALPENVVGNEPIAARLGIDGSWIERRTGIRERRHVRDERVSDLAAAAGAAALADAGLAASEVDLILVATMSSDELTPNTAPLVAHALGTNAAAADVGAACTGFLSALSLAGAQIESGRATHALVIGAEAMSRFVDFDDRRTAGLFGDGAGAVVLSAGRGALGPVVLRSAGEHASFIVAPRDTGLIRMEGHETFLVAVASLSEATLDVCRAAGVDPSDIDLFIYHQANARILTAVADKLDLERDRVVDAIGELGNTSAASIPLALSLAADAGRVAPGDRVLVAAVGAGFTYGAALLDWEGS